MSLVINTNTAALSSQRSLLVTQTQQAQTFQRLATGLRVNSARDKEVDQMIQEIKRIGQKLLHNPAQAQTLQIGFNNTENARISTGLEGGIIGAMDGEAVEGTHPAVQTVIDAAQAAAADGGLDTDKQAYWAEVANAWAAETSYSALMVNWGEAYLASGGMLATAAINMVHAIDLADNDSFESWGVDGFGIPGESYLNDAAAAMNNYSASTAAENAAKNAFIDAVNALAGMASPNEIHNFSSDGGDLGNALTNVINGNLDANRTINISNQAGCPLCD